MKRILLVVSIAFCSVFQMSGQTANGHAYVDLGLSVKWATCNVGASSPAEYGDFFAWGEIRPKAMYMWENYVFRISGESDYDVVFSRYNTDSQWGEVDNNRRLERMDDAARVRWGNHWRMPTRGELKALIENCTWTWTTLDGKNGYKVTSKINGNSIFLPASGYQNDNSGPESVWCKGTEGCYWSSMVNSKYPFMAAYLLFSESEVLVSNNGARCGGRAIRPVMD